MNHTDKYFIYSHGNKEPDAMSVMCSCCLGAISMLCKESGITIFGVNIIFDIYRNWAMIRENIKDVRWNSDNFKFAKRIFSVFMSMMLLVLARISPFVQGSFPKFSQSDNPAAFHESFQVRFLTFLYLSSFNCWLLLCPNQLSHDWQFSSIPLIVSFRDTRNILTVLTLLAIFAMIYKIYNDLEVRKHTYSLQQLSNVI